MFILQTCRWVRVGSGDWLDSGTYAEPRLDRPGRIAEPERDRTHLARDGYRIQCLDGAADPTRTGEPTLDRSWLLTAALIPAPVH